jgi:hypothetical protein
VTADEIRIFNGDVYQIGDHVTRLSDGVELVIRDVRPVMDVVFYDAEEVQTGARLVISHKRVRPFTPTGSRP